MGIKENFQDIMMVDEQGKVEYFNISSVDFFGLKPDELIGTYAHDHYNNLNIENSTLMRALNYKETAFNVMQELETSDGKTVRQNSDTFCVMRGEEPIGAIEFAYYDKDKDLLNVSHRRQKSKSEEKGEVKTIGDIVGISPAIAELRRKLEKIANLDSPVLISGETGTGKTFMAEVLHNSGKRQGKNFVYVNCSTIPENLFESILFGVKKGAFTDATERDGLIMSANGGTILLDEIQAIPLSVQSKLLRVLEEKRIRPIGGEEEKDVDVRIIASCNVDVDTLLSSEDLRKDLYFRLAVIQLETPPLRTRREDIMCMVEYFLEDFNKNVENKGIRTVDERTRKYFMDYDWLGNVRELRNILESAFYTSESGEIKFDDIKGRLCRDSKDEDREKVKKTPACVEDFLKSGKALNTFLEDYSKSAVLMELEKNSGNIKKASEALGLSLPMMKYDMKKFGIE